MCVNKNLVHISQQQHLRYFFLIFVNDMDRGIINWLLKFADDMKLFGKVQTQLDYDGLQKDLQRLLDWSKECQMEFNIDKLCVWRHNMPQPRPLYARYGPPPVHSLHALRLGRPARLVP